MGLAPAIPRAVNYIGETFYNRVEEEVVLFRIVFQISILHNYIISRCLLETTVQCRSLAFVHGLVEIADVRIGMCLRIAGNRPARVILRTVVHQNQLFCKSAYQIYCQYFIKNEMDGLLFVIYRNDDGKLHDGVMR